MKISKMILHNDNLEASIQSFHFRNDGAIFSIKINKDWLLTLIRCFAIIGVFIGYVLITYISYSINEAHFWTLIKIGIILSMLLGIALSKKLKLSIEYYDNKRGNAQSETAK